MGILYKTVREHRVERLSGGIHDIAMSANVLLRRTKGVVSFGVTLTIGHTGYRDTERMDAILYYTQEVKVERFPKLMKYFKRYDNKSKRNND